MSVQLMSSVSGGRGGGKGESLYLISNPSSYKNSLEAFAEEKYANEEIYLHYQLYVMMQFTMMNALEFK